MPNKTPLEQYIAETGGDRRATYERNMRAKGNKKLTLWVPETQAEGLRNLASALVHCEDASAFQPQLIALVATVAGACK